MLKIMRASVSLAFIGVGLSLPATAEVHQAQHAVGVIASASAHSGAGTSSSSSGSQDTSTSPQPTEEKKDVKKSEEQKDEKESKGKEDSQNETMEEKHDDHASAVSTPTDNPVNSVVLETITVEAARRARQQTQYDTTQLGVIGKTAAQLQSGQVEGIRDLTRYDSGISVNESGGRGTSRGFSIRGVEKERVAVSVDGFAMAPILRRNDRPNISSPSTQSSAMQEVETENLKMVSIREGASSSENGTGSLGGSVAMRTKDTSDFFYNDKDSIAGRLKVGLTTKDGRRMVSLALAGRSNRVEGFVQFTGRKGHELQAHDSLYNGTSWIEYLNPDRWYDVKGQPSYLWVELPEPEVSGPTRLIPNPMNYGSHSLLSKVGTFLTLAHYIGLVYEDTRQGYFIRDMSAANYHNAPGRHDDWVPLFQSLGIYGNAWTPTRYFDDYHTNRRLGVEYKYQPSSSTPWIDQAELDVDWRTVGIQSKVLTLNCMPWPSVSPNCHIGKTTDFAGQRVRRNTAILYEDDFRLAAEASKRIKWGPKKNIALRLMSGWMHSTYHVDDTIYSAKNNYFQKNTYTGKCDSGGIAFQRHNERTDKNDTLCWKLEESKEFYTTGPVKADLYYISLSQILHYNKWGVSASARVDRTVYKHNPGAKQEARGDVFRGAKYTNPSFDLGVSYQPIRQLQLSTRYSTGFRVPSAIEVIGPSFNTEATIRRFLQGPLKPETSSNFELGFQVTTPTLKLKGSYFLSHYYNIIDIAAKTCQPEGYGHCDYNYHNAHEFWTQGFNVRANVDLHEFWNKIPEGAEFFMNMGLVAVKGKAKLLDDFSLVSSYAFDAVQPFKVVWGFNYLPYSEKWGLTLTNTISDTKDPRDLQTTSKQGGLVTVGVRSAEIVPDAWHTTDLQLFYRFKPHITFRFGVFNLFNYKYMTWESARQISFGAEARINTNNQTVLAAPGRNFQLSLEAEF